MNLAEDAMQRRRQAEAQLVSLQADLESARAQRVSSGDDRESDSAFQMRVLQELVQKQEDEIKEARHLKSHFRCVACARRLIELCHMPHWSSAQQ